MKRFAKYYFFIFITFLILLHPEDSIRYAKNALVLCTDILYPSLFPFFVCSGLLVYSGLCEYIARFFSPVMRPLFNIGGSGAAAFVLGIVSGYPIGAEVACKLYDNGSISKSECERLLAFCNNSGPLFILGAIGVSVYKSPKIGAMLYFVHILAAISVGLILRFCTKATLKNDKKYAEPKDIPFPEIFSNALKGSIKSILTVCGCVVFFAVISNLIADLIPITMWRTVFISFSELTTGIKTISDSELSEYVKIILSAAAAGFAGFCVHLQVMSVAFGRGLSLRLYLIGKLMHSAISALYMYILLRFIPVTATVFAQGASLSGAFFAASLFTTGTVLLLLIFSVLGVIIRTAKNHIHS